MTEEAARGEPLDLAPLNDALGAYGVRVGARLIRPGDEAAFASEAASDANLPRRRASGAARIVARALLAELGAEPDAPLARSASGAPVWPRGILGSLAHDEAYAAACVARQGGLAGLGVDVEPAEPLPEDLVGYVLSPAERRETGRDQVAQRLVFVCKEAVYKAVHPLDRTGLEYDDIEVDLARRIATLKDGRRLRLLVWTRGRLLAVAVLEA